MEVLVLYWLFSSLFICGVSDEWDWKEQPLKCFFISFGFGWFVFPIFLGSHLFDRW